MAEDEMVRRHYQLNGHESEQTLGDNEGQRSLACCSPWGLKESDTIEQLNHCGEYPETFTEHLLNAGYHAEPDSI